NLVQRRERSHGKGNSRSSFVADRKIDARSQAGTAPDGNTVMREPANKRMLTDVSGLRFHRCTIIASISLPFLRRGRVGASRRLDRGHKRMREWAGCKAGRCVFDLGRLSLGRTIGGTTMAAIALLGAGGKMGHRLARNLKDSPHQL